MRALSIIAWAAAPSSTVPSSPPPGAGASDCHSSQRCQSAELATAHRPSQKSWAAFARDSQDLAHTTKPAMAILVAALLVAPSPGLGHACSTPRRRLGSPSQRGSGLRKNRATNRHRKWVTCDTRNFGHSCKSFMNGVVVWFTPRPMLALAVAVLTVPTTHVVCETSVAVGDGRIVFELWPHSAPGRLAVNVCALPTTLIHI